MANYTTNYYEMINYQDFTEEEILDYFKQYDLSDFLLPSQIETINNAGMWSKDKLARKIYDTYFMREIGQETTALHKLQMKSKLNSVMEKYLPLIYTASLDYELLVNEDYTEEYTRKIDGIAKSEISNNGNANSSSSSNGSGLSVNSDTPEGQISKTAILNGDYASSTSANENTASTSSESITSSNSINEGENSQLETLRRHVKGNHGISSTYQALIKQYRENIVDYNTQIIKELNILYMGIY